MFKSFLSILAGLFAAFVVVLVVEMALPYLFKINMGDPQNKDAMEAFMKTVPTTFLVAIALTYGVAAFAGTYITVLISGNSKNAYLTLLLFLIVVMINFFSFTHPYWMIALGVIVSIMGGYLGSMVKKDTI